MKHLAQSMMSVELRAPYLKRRERRLKEALRRPGIRAEERKFLLQALDQLGKPKEYLEDEKPLPGAIDPGPMPPVEIALDLDEMTFENLSTIPHAKLYLYAQQEGLEIKPGDTKAVIVKTILTATQGEKR